MKWHEKSSIKSESEIKPETQAELEKKKRIDDNSSYQKEYKLRSKIYLIVAAFMMLLIISACGQENNSGSETEVKNDEELETEGASELESESNTEIEGDGGTESENQTETQEESDTEANDETKTQVLPDLPQGEVAAQGEAFTSGLDSANSNYTMYDFLWNAISDIDEFWSAVWSQAGYQEPFVQVAFPGPGEQVNTECSKTGVTDPKENAENAFYCGLDDQLVFPQEFATAIWEGTVTQEGAVNSRDFAVVYVLAHEYSHSLQNELDIVPSKGEARLYPVYKTELHADCWAGIWANSAYYRGLLEVGDVEEAIATAQEFGDYDFEEPGHHGTPEERTGAFMTGYNSGNAMSCDPYLLNEY